MRAPVSAYLGRYRGGTGIHAESELRVFLRSCADQAIEPLAAVRLDTERYVRWLQDVRRYQPSTVSRRLSVAVGFYRICVIDGILLHSPADHVRRPTVPAESPTLGLGHLQFEALITTARLSANPNDFALIALLGLLGLRIFEACGTSMSDLSEEHGHRVLRVRGKGGKVVLIPLPPAVARAIDRTIEGRFDGPILRNTLGARMDRHAAMRHLRALGFDILTTAGSPNSRTAAVSPATPITAPGDGREWPWDGNVQGVFVNLLRQHGWSITAAADTATKAPGVDVLAIKTRRRLGAEVKGWPSVGYADPRRAAETKRTQPSTQAGHWFSQALFKAIMLLDSHPGHESLVVLPDHPRYQDLAQRTRTGRRAANIHVILLARDGSYTSESWTP